ncbi:MAG TPA: F0F1 ATP synthase subunit B [Bacteroidales bacterium]|nr:F0F1 ATP synthase subunit B [Bacteroidales bacterium]
MLLSFGIVLFVLTKYAWKPILKGIRNRESKIEEALLAADRTKAEMAKLQADNEKILAEARTERDKLIQEARLMKDKIIDEAKAAAAEESHKLIQTARQSIEQEKKAALKEIKDQVSELSVLVAEKILKEKLSGTTNQNEYIEKLLGEIKLN